LSTDVSGVNSELFVKGVVDSPFPIIFSDENNNPIPTFWRNVGIEPNDRSEVSMRKLKRMIEKMDRINPPDTLYNLALKPRTDTLVVYELPPSKDLPMAVTDQSGAILYSRNLEVSPDGPSSMLRPVNEVDAIPLSFSKVNEPPLIFHDVSGQENWPLIVTKKNGDPLYWNDVDVEWNEKAVLEKVRLTSFLRLMNRSGVVYELVTHNVYGYDIQLFHYGDPRFVTWIAWLPVIEFIVILILITVGFIGFKNITNVEKRSIWVGMAKETAHQLGTPISSIYGWLELLKTDRDAALLGQAVEEMEFDVKRLNRVASRFSSIGSKPELQPTEVSDVVEEVMDYYRARAPHMGRSVILESRYHNLSRVMGNRELLNWAFENLIKNSLASIEDKEGQINVTGRMSKDFRHLILDFKDNGRGIPYANQKEVMKPGYTTKKRGWGLGLSLVKRIIEDYHGGKILLLESEPGAGTTFRVILPAVKGKV
ncbi:unnamed protein product, partial [marine sediment metagenome]